jgi:hypothetical protein
LSSTGNYNYRSSKNRVITEEHISAIKKDKITRALSVRDPDSLGLDFPFNLSIYKRILKHGESKILYCSEHMLQRDAYIDRDNLESIKPEVKPCPKYK